MKIYTKKGDGGQTSLIGGQRVKKDHDRLYAYGCLDELNSTLGVARAHLSESMKEEIDEVLFEVQNKLFNIGSYLACESSQIRETLPLIHTDDILLLEKVIDKYDAQLPPLKQFILPGGHKAASYIHVARTICRRAERETIKIEDPDNEKLVIPYLNRLSDLLFVLARKCNHIANQEDISWKK